ncbi:MAG TPA: DUF4886 domain-containing protein [Firmicutes bacterium]|nr:DUF4886 domain-containing protein [Bacillota bacterium]
MLRKPGSRLLLLLLLASTLCAVYVGGVAADPATSTLRILAIGNSFSVDAMQHLYQIAADAGVKKIVLGNLYIGGCTLATHYGNAKSNAARYVYYKNTNGTWTSQANQTMLFGIKDEDWDIITIQQASGLSGVLSSYLEGETLPYLIRYVHDNKTNPQAKLVWHMTWAYQQDSSHASFPTYNRNQMDMYRAIVDAVQKAILPDPGFAFIIPTGTAIQNVRTSYIGDILTRDGYHLSYNLGRYIAGLTWFHAITGQPIDQITWVPSEVEIPAAYMPIIKEAVQAAVINPFAVTPSSYATKWLADALPDSIEQPEIPVQLKTPSFDIQQVNIEIDGQTLYSGNRPPDDLKLQTAALAHGKHLLTVTLTDTAGKTYSESVEFAVEHYQLKLLPGKHGNNIHGVITIQFVSIIKPEEYLEVELALVPVVESLRTEPKTLYVGTALPDEFILDTRLFVDGAYDLDVLTTTSAGAYHHRQERIVIKNWTKLEDPIEPPMVSSWFGNHDRLLTVNRSAGWTFTNEAPERFFGDDNRITPSSQSSEYLTWELPNLERFELTFYAQPEHLEDIVEVMVSVDATTWTTIPYTVHVLEQQSSGWAKVQVTGVVPPTSPANYIRLVMDMSGRDNLVELGHVLLSAPIE